MNGGADAAGDSRAGLAQALLSVGVAARGDGGVVERLARICEAMTEILGCDRSSVFLLDGDDMIPTANFGNPPDVAAVFHDARFPASDRIFSRTIASNEPVFVADAPSSPHLIAPDLAASARIRSLIMARLDTTGTDPGVITAEFNETEGSFGAFDSAVVQGLAQIAALVLDDEATRRREARLVEEIQWRADHDDLTGLANRRALGAWFANLASSAQPSTTVAVLLADLDRFKVVNDALGHAAGDRILVALADRLRRAFQGTQAEVVRFGGDEFVIAAVVQDQDHAERLAADLAAALVDPVAATPSQSLVMTASVGIALSTVGNLQPGVLLSDADAAMYVAKSQRRGQSVLARGDMRPIVSHRFALEVSLAKALGDREITPWFQPIIDVASGRCVAVEALARWSHPTRGTLEPASFLPSLAEMGLLRELTDCVLSQAASVFESAAFDGLLLFQNLSVTDIDDDLASRLLSMFPDAARLVVELTERDAMHQVGNVESILAGLRSSGVRVALDDFGTGYSSLSLLADLPLDIVKIDRSLVAGIVDQRKAETVRATIRLGSALGLSVLAEGVEEREELAELKGSSVDLAQGFLFARAMTAADFASAVESGALIV